MKVATWNVGDGMDAVKMHGLVKLLKHGADVIGLQECGDRKRLVDEFCERTGWQAWLGADSPGAASVPILWNPRTARATVTGTRDATPATYVGPAGAGPSVMKAKVWNRVRFAGRRPSGTDLVVVNGHVVPSIYLRRRRALAHVQIDALAEMVERREDDVEDGELDVIAVGDFNMRPSHSLTKPLRRLGMVQRTDDPTHGRRTIDHVWTLGVRGEVAVLEMPSDHNAALLTVKEIR